MVGMPKKSSGYSGTPLAQKLGIKPGMTVATVGAPATYRDLVSPMPEDVTIATKVTPAAGVVHLFATKRSVLAAALASAMGKTSPTTAIWVSWPKQASKVPTDITENPIRDVALPLGLVDIKVCAVDATWSGLKLVTRKSNRR